jgi:hypothetical protein
MPRDKTTDLAPDEKEVVETLEQPEVAFATWKYG